MSDKRYHDSCGSEVIPDDPEEPMWWCPVCEDTVHSEDTNVGAPPPPPEPEAANEP